MAGRDVLRVDVTQPFKQSIWIDAKTNLIVQTRAEVMNNTILVKFGPPKVNQTIPASRFKK